ncbi:MAG: hypothetical protein RL885_31595 [Planctomycetota bacterium]
MIPRRRRARTWLLLMGLVVMPFSGSFVDGVIGFTTELVSAVMWSSGDPAAGVSSGAFIGGGAGLLLYLVFVTLFVVLADDGQGREAER